MKNLLILVLLSAISYAKIVTIIDNGVERKIYLPDNKSILGRMVDSKNTNQPGIIIAFKKNINVDIKEFESKYNLKLKKRLVAGYYIFNNFSTLADVKLINKITKESRNIIKTIRPNWGFNNKAR